MISAFSRWTFACALVCFIATPAHAEKTWKYDDGPDDLGTLAGSKMHAQYAHPGFVSQEAFGAVFKPEAADYPIDITAIDLIMAAPANEPDPISKKVNATIEIWVADNDGPKPDTAKPLWTVHTSDFFNSATQKPGTPIQGNTVMKFEFKSSKAGDKPPTITKGNIWVMVRLTSNTSDYSLSYWSQAGCFKGEILGIEGCGCQDLAALTDSATTPKTQVVNIVWPLGKCSGDKAWKFVEQLTNETGFTMTGDFRLRMRTAGGGGSSSGGSSGGTSSGGSSSGGTEEDAGSTGPDIVVAPAQPKVNLVTPDNGLEGEVTLITIIGSDFEVGATVQVGAEAAEVVSVTTTEIKARVSPALATGVFAVIVKNTNGQTGFKDKSFTVKAKEVAQPDAGADSGGGGFNPGGNVSIDAIAPNVVPCTEDTEVTIIGEGFGAGMEFEVGGRPLLAVNVEAGNKATGLIPKGLAAGKHSLIGKFGGKQAAKANAVEVTCEDGGCSAQPTPANRTAPLLLLLATAMGALWIRRRTA